MFATLVGGLPRPHLEAGAPVETLVEAAVRAQEEAGLEPITDADLRSGPPSVAAWEATAQLTPLAVKQAVIGPYTAAADSGADAGHDVALDRATELNGFLTYDREVMKMPVERVRKANQAAIDAAKEQDR